MRMLKIEEEAKMTLEEAMNDFLNFKRAQQPAARTMRDYESYLKNFLEFSNNSLEEKILNRDILAYFAQIPDTSPARFNHPYQNLSTFFNWAVAQDIIRKNPIVTQGLKKKRDDGNIKPASIDDVKTLLNSFDKSIYTGFRNYVIILLMLDTGIRTSEVLKLKVNDFDAAAQQILINKAVSKTRRNRIAYLSNSTAAALSKLIKITPKEWGENIFFTRDGETMTTEAFDREIARQCKKAGVKFTPYQLRHTFATYFVQGGGDIFTLQELMGHSDIRMTKRYTEIDSAQKREAHSIYSPVNELSGKTRIVNI